MALPSMKMEEGRYQSRDRLRANLGAKTEDSTFGSRSASG